MSLLLATLPVEGFGFTVEKNDTCSTCRCCVQPNSNPAPARNVPTTASKTISVEGEARIEPQPFSCPSLPTLDFSSALSLDAHMRVSSVPLFQRHCLLLI